MSDMQRRILEGIRQSEDSGLQMYATEPSGSMSENDETPEEFTRRMFDRFVSPDEYEDAIPSVVLSVRSKFPQVENPNELVNRVWNELMDQDIEDYPYESDLEEAEEDGWPKKLKKGRFTEYCKEQGFDGPCQACARKAMKSDDASVRGMATFYMNTVKPGGKTSSDVAAKEESVTEKGDPMKYAMPSDEENRLRSEYMSQFRADVEKLRAMKDAGKKDSPEWKELVELMNDREAEYARAEFQERQKRVHALIMSDFEDDVEEAELPYGDKSGRKGDPSKASTDLPNPRAHLKGKKGAQVGSDADQTVKPLDEGDDWVSLEEMETECPDCACKMRNAGFKRIKRHMVDECKKAK